MKRIIFLATLVTVGALSLGVAAFQQPPAAAAPKVVEVEKLRDNLFMLKGGGGNTAVFVRTDGITVVDTKNPGWGQPILDKIKKLSTKPVTTIINTHTHGDHVSGNVEFPATVEVIVQENTKANMQEMRGATGIAQTGPPTNIFKVNNGRGMPTKTFKDKMTVGKGADEIDLFYFGRGHTNGDAWVVFPALRVVHAGDIFSGKNMPLLDANNGGSGVTDWRHAREGRQEPEEHRHHHHRPQHDDDDGRPRRVRRVQQGLHEGRAGREEGRQDGGRGGGQLEDSGEVQGYTAPRPAAMTRLKANVQIVFDETK